ncbi:MAG TPA: glycosyltransferase family 4 protein [Candidatus Eisenbacteria bacterium]|nr:glycosyltransferase family 4 protein [Candidatus Eisenbacteria bacterium]
MLVEHPTRMRVIHVITRLIVGGAQENTVASVLGLQQKTGMEVSLISGPTTGPEGSLEFVFNAHPELLTVVPALVRPVHPWKDWLALQRLTKLFRTRRPDLVHTHSGKAGILGRLAAHRAQVPTIIHTIHGPSFGQFQGSLPNLVFKTAELLVAQYTTHFVTVANAMTRQYLAAGIGQSQQYSRIFSGFQLEPFLMTKNDLQLRASLGIAQADFVVGNISRLFKLKGHDDLFAMAPALVKEFPHFKFLLIGDGPWRQRFEQKASSPQLRNHFVFAGLIPPAEIPSYVGIMDALIHLSTREGLPRALPQALAAARPVVAYDCDGAGEVCRENETGFLLPPGDLSGIMDRLRRLCSDAALRERLGHAGQELVRQNFSVERMVDDLYALYLRLNARAFSI